MAVGQKLTFHSWKRSVLFKGAVETNGHLKGTLQLRATESDGSDPVDGQIDFLFYSAADIGAIDRSEIKHLAPAPGVLDAEMTKVAHIDFRSPDFPWRFTPKPASVDKLTPWVTLLVGTDSELQVADQYVFANADVLKTTDLVNVAPLLAHSHDEGPERQWSRLLAARQLEEHTDYIAVVVPTFDQTGNFSWRVDAPPAQPLKLTKLFSWRFRTAEKGDFKTLAEALTIPPALDTGLAKLDYTRIEPPVQLQIRGAITSIQQAKRAEAEDKVEADLDQLTVDLAGLGAIPMTQYGQPWVEHPDGINYGWPHDLNDDPRYRGIAGLGVQMGIENQESLIDAAITQAGALREAGQRINYMALGLAAAGGLWERRIAADPMQRLRIFAPMLDRMESVDGQSGLQSVTGGTSPIPSAFFTGSAQRVLRRRSHVSKRLTTGETPIDRRKIVDLVNQPDPVPVRAPEGLPHFDNLAAELEVDPEAPLGIDLRRHAKNFAQLVELADRAIRRYQTEKRLLEQAGQAESVPGIREQIAHELAGEIIEAAQQLFTVEIGLRCEGQQMVAEAVGGPDVDQVIYFQELLEYSYLRNRFLERLWLAVRNCTRSQPCNLDLLAQLRIADVDCGGLVGLIPPDPPSEHQPIDPDRLISVITEAIDPRGDDPPGKQRLCARLEGIDCSRLIPPEFPIGLDFPTWDLLRRTQKEWLLPGAGKIPKESITALQSNPAFIDAYLTGINMQFMSEMRWRSLPVERLCTPLRMFWGQVDYTTRTRVGDIEPLLEWTNDFSQPVGAIAHQHFKPEEGAEDASRLIVVFNTPLFRRYPSTLVYLYRPDPVHLENPPDDDLRSSPEFDPSPGLTPAQIEGWRKNHKHLGPIYSGAITPDLVFFGFDIPPAELGQFWLVLDEPPAELRFLAEQNPEGFTTAATYATGTIDKPTRVAISGKELLDQGLHA